MEAFCELRGYKHLRLDGSTHPKRRRIDIARFSASDSDHLIYHISNRAGGLGLNLQVADAEIHFDTDWKSKSTAVEERILFRAQQKLYLDAIVNEGSQKLNDDSSEGLDLQDQESLRSIKLGAQETFQTDNYDTLHNFDLDALLSGSTKIWEEQGKSDVERLNYNAEDFDFSMALLTETNFQGRVSIRKNSMSLLSPVGGKGNARSVVKRTSYQTLSSGPPRSHISDRVIFQ